MLTRKRVPELMDDPSLDAGLHHEALRGLEKLNVVSSSVDLLWSQLKTLPKLRSAAKRTLRIVDVASGAGDIPVGLCKRAKAEGVCLEIVALDISETAIEYASAKANSANASIQFLQLDALKELIPIGFDAAICSLFTHHLDPPDVIRLIQNMRAASNEMLIINDLVRSELSFAMVWLGTRLLSRSKIVQYDGPVSVRASYTCDEMMSMASDAGLSDARSLFYPPCRQLLVWRRVDD